MERKIKLFRNVAILDNFYQFSLINNILLTNERKINQVFKSVIDTKLIKQWMPKEIHGN